MFRDQKQMRPAGLEVIESLFAQELQNGSTSIPGSGTQRTTDLETYHIVSQSPSALERSNK